MPLNQYRWDHLILTIFFSFSICSFNTLYLKLLPSLWFSCTLVTPIKLVIQLLPSISLKNTLNILPWLIVPHTLSTCRCLTVCSALLTKSRGRWPAKNIGYWSGDPVLHQQVALTTATANRAILWTRSTSASKE